MVLHTHWAACQGTCSCFGCTLPGPQCNWPRAESSFPAKSEGHTHTPHTVYLTPHTLYGRPHTLSEYLELFLETSSAYFSLCLQLVEGDPEVGCLHLCVPTQYQLSQSIMNKHILSLQRDSLLMHALCVEWCLAHLCLHHHYALASHAPEEVVHTEAAL